MLYLYFELSVSPQFMNFALVVYWSKIVKGKDNFIEIDTNRLSNVDN